MLRRVLDRWRDETGGSRADMALLLSLFVLVTLMWYDRIGGASGLHTGLHCLRASVRNIASWLP